jgi:hypothetical protein
MITKSYHINFMRYLYKGSMFMWYITFLEVYIYIYRKMLDLQHQYNNCTTIPHMRVGPIYWGPPSCEGLLYSCCIRIVQESNPIYIYKTYKK